MAASAKATRDQSPQVTILGIVADPSGERSRATALDVSRRVRRGRRPYGAPQLESRTEPRNCSASDRAIGRGSSSVRRLIGQHAHPCLAASLSVSNAAPVTAFPALIPIRQRRRVGTTGPLSDQAHSTKGAEKGGRSMIVHNIHETGDVSDELDSYGYATRQVVAVVLTWRHRVGLFKRSSSARHDAGAWHCITGYLDDDTSPMQQAAQELWEETGLSVSDLQQLTAGPTLQLADPRGGQAWTVHTFAATTNRRRLDSELGARCVPLGATRADPKVRRPGPMVGGCPESHHAPLRCRAVVFAGDGVCQPR